MAIAPIVSVSGVNITNVVEVRWSIEASSDRDLYPTHGVSTTGILVRRKADTDLILADWASSADNFNLRSGKIAYLDFQGELIKTLRFEKAFVHDYQLSFNPKSGHMEETVIIQTPAYHIEPNKQGGGEESFYPYWSDPRDGR